MHQKYATAGDVVFLNVDVRDPRDKLDSYLNAQQGASSMRHIHDEAGKLAKAWDVRFYPTFFVVDESGNIRAAGNLTDQEIEEMLRDFEVRRAQAAAAPAKQK